MPTQDLLQKTLRVASPPVRARGVRLRVVDWLPLVLVAVLYVAATSGPAIFDQNEGQYAAAAREMLDLPGNYTPATHGRLERGQWLVPTNDGIPRLQKPPLVYWMLMGSMRLFGINEFSARLPNTLITLLWFWAVFLLGRRLGGARLGLAAALVLATMAGTFVFTHLVAPEPFLAAFLTLTFWCFASAWQEPEKATRWMRLAWLFMALGVLAKGLHGALYPLAVAGFLAWRHPSTRPVWKGLGKAPGLLLFVALVVPWYAAMESRFPGFLRDQLFNEQLGHMFNRRFPPDSERTPFVMFWLEHLVLWLPWTLFIPAAFQGRSSSRAEMPAGIGRDLLAAWFWVTVGSIVFSTLQDYYLLTAWPPVAFWIARPWVGGRVSGFPRWMTAGPGIALAAVGLAAFAVAAFLGLHHFTPAAPGAADLPALRDGIWMTVSGFSVSVWQRLLPLLWTAGGAFLIGGAASAALAWRGRMRAVLPAVAGTMAAVLLVAAGGLNVLEDYFSLKRSALAINRAASPDAMVVCNGLAADSPSLLYYIDREVYRVGGSPAGEFASRELHIGSGLFLSPAEFAARWASGQPTFFITEEAQAGQWRAILPLTPAQETPIARSGTRVVLANRPN